MIKLGVNIETLDNHEKYIRDQIRLIKRGYNAYIYDISKKKDLDRQLKDKKIKVTIRTIWKIAKKQKPVKDYWIYRRKY